MRSRFSQLALLLQTTIFFVSLPLVVIISAGEVPDNNSDDAEFASAWQAIDAVANQLIAEHINPPTRQQMMMSACRGLFIADNILPPRDLSLAFSNCLNDQDFQKALQKYWDERTAATKLKPEQLQRFAVSSMLYDCDPGIQYVSPKDYLVQKQLTENQYVGIGIQLSRTDDGWVKITKPFYGGAAHKAGARVGDLIVTINGESIQGRDFREVIDLLRGPKGSQLDVGLRHESEQTVRAKTMTRDVIPLPSIVGREQNQNDGTWKIAMPSHADIAHLKFESIVGSTAAEMMEMARQVEKGNFTGVILDFRGQNGRTQIQIHHAIMLIDTLISSQKIGDIMTPDGSREITTQADSILNDLPMVILSDQVVPGPLFMVLSSLANRDLTLLVGSDVQSNGMCRKSVELENQLGALNGVSFALVYPHENATNAGVIRGHDQDVMPIEIAQLAPRFLLRPQVQMDQSETGQQGLLKTAVEALRSLTTNAG